MKLPSDVLYVLLVALILLIVLGSSDAGQAYPVIVQEATEEPLFRLGVLLLLILASYQHISLGILLAVVFVFMMLHVPLLQKGTEGFSNGSPLHHCGTYTPKSIQQTGTAFYPLNDSEGQSEIRGKDVSEIKD